MKVQIIIGSARKGRSTPLVANWVKQTADKVLADKADIEIVDLADFDLPLFDEAVSPKYNQDRQPEGDVKQWLDTLARADGYIFVTPEYNHSIPGALKNAIDYIAYETNKKAATIVSHIASELGLVTTPVAVNLVGYVGLQPILNEDGTLVNDKSGAQGVLESALEQLIWYTAALKTARG